MFYIRSVISVAKRFLKKEYLNTGLSIPLARLFAPLTSFFVKKFRINKKVRIL